MIEPALKKAKQRPGLKKESWRGVISYHVHICNIKFSMFYFTVHFSLDPWRDHDVRTVVNGAAKYAYSCRCVKASKLKLTQPFSLCQVLKRAAATK